MAITQAMATSFKKELLEAKHNFLASGGNTFKLALYTSSATMSAATTAFTTTNEAAGTNYTSGGAALTNIDPASSGTTAFTDFSDVSYASASFTANGALIYNTTTDGGSGTTDAVAVIAFGSDKTATNGTFTIQFPANDSSNAIIRLA